MNLYGEILPEAKLRFDYSSSYAVASNPRPGLKKFGPYDSNLFEKDRIECGIIYPNSLKNLKPILINGLTAGDGNFMGFERLFRVPLVFEEEQSVVSDNKQEIRRASRTLVTKDLDLIFILTSRRNPSVYRTCKSELLGNGIPSQVVIGDRLQNPSQRQWILENIALASYAKVGGTPWVVANPVQHNQLVLGISRVQDVNKQFFVGFVTLFTNDGDFLLMHSKAPVIRWEDYTEGLTNLIHEAIDEYEKSKGIPDSIIVHLHKRPGYKELEAIQGALENSHKQIPYALLHLNEYSNIRLFDTSHPSYVPQSGLKVDIGRRQSLLLLDGRIWNQRRKMGVPRVLDITMDKRSTLPFDEFSILVRQIHDFAQVNWRGFNAASIPTTLNYAHLIARLIVEVGSDHWNEIIAAGRLKNKAWFL